MFDDPKNWKDYKNLSSSKIFKMAPGGHLLSSMITSIPSTFCAEV